MDWTALLEILPTIEKGTSGALKLFKQLHERGEKLDPEATGLIMSIAMVKQNELIMEALNHNQELIQQHQHTEERVLETLTNYMEKMQDALAVLVNRTGRRN